MCCETLLKRGYETRSFEFKGRGFRTQAGFLNKVIRAILGMANQRDGGKVILGVESDPLDAVGLFPPIQPLPMPADIVGLFKDQVEDLQ